MSDDNIEQMTKEQNQDGQLDVKTLLSEEGSSEADESNLDLEGEKSADKIEVEQIDLSDLAGSQPDDAEEREHNNIYATQRHTAKKLKDLQAQIADGNVPEAHAFKPEALSEKPRLADFTSEARIQTEFNDDSAIALATYHEAMDDWKAQGSQSDVKRDTHNANLANNVEAQIANEESFDSNVKKFRETVKGIDGGLAAAEKLYGEEDFNAIRNTVGDNAPIVLAVLGSDSSEQKAFAAVVAGGNQLQVIQHLTRLEDKLLRKMPSTNQISKSNAEIPLGGGSGGDSGDLQANIDKAAKAGNSDEYMRLKDIQRGLESKR